MFLKLITKRNNPASEVTKPPEQQKFETPVGIKLGVQKQKGSLLKKGQLGETPSPKRLLGQLGAASQLLCVLINNGSNQKLKHQMQKIEKLQHWNFNQNIYGKKQSKYV